MKFVGIVAAFALAVGSTASAQIPSPPAAWQTTVDRYLEGRLKDPMSAVKRITRGPRQGSVQAGFATNFYGWAVCYEVNAKNTYGGYGGFKRFVFVFDESGVVGMLSDENRQEVAIDAECALPADMIASEQPLTAL